jgi:hypothetical protein
VCADLLAPGELGQVAVNVETALARLLVVARGHGVVDEPGEDVAHAGLPGLVAPHAADDPAVDHPAHAGDLGQLVAVHDMARAGPHDHEHLAGLDRLRRRRRHVGVDVADRDRDPLAQACPPGGLRGEVARARAELGQRPTDLLGHEVREALVQRAQVVRARVGAVLEDGLVAGGARVARLAAAQLPDDPVGAFDPAVHALVDLGVLLEDLQRLGELPLRGDSPSVARQPRLAALGGQRVDAIGLGLRGVVLPQLGVGVQAVGELGQAAQGGAVGEDRERGGGGEVGGDADDLLGPDAGGLNGRRHRAPEDLDPVVGVLERPLRRERCRGCGQFALDHCVCVVVDRRAQLGAVADPDDDGAARQGPEVDADDARVRRRSHRLWAASRARRYSSTTISVSSSTEVSDVGLSSVMTPSWIRLTRSQAVSTCT